MDSLLTNTSLRPVDQSIITTSKVLVYDLSREVNISIRACAVATDTNTVLDDRILDDLCAVWMVRVLNDTRTSNVFQVRRKNIFNSNASLALVASVFVSDAEFYLIANLSIDRLFPSTIFAISETDFLVYRVLIVEYSFHLDGNVVRIVITTWNTTIKSVGTNQDTVSACSDVIAKLPASVIKVTTSGSFCLSLVIVNKRRTVDIV